MRIGLATVGMFVALAGMVWIAQGLELPFAPGSFMTGNRAWVVIGAVAVLLGLVVVECARRRP